MIKHPASSNQYRKQKTPAPRRDERSFTPVVPPSLGDRIPQKNAPVKARRVESSQPHSCRARPKAAMPCALITVASPSRTTCGFRPDDRRAFGGRLLGPFGVCAGAGFHPLRLSVTPLRHVLYPITACNVLTYNTKQRKCQARRRKERRGRSRPRRFQRFYSEASSSAR